MNKQEQRMKLWCDVYLSEYSELRNADDCAKYATEAVKAFDEAFGEPSETTQPETESGVYLTREEADEIFKSVFAVSDSKIYFEIKELLKIKP